jgi:hypothetical protein
MSILPLHPRHIQNEAGEPSPLILSPDDITDTTEKVDETWVVPKEIEPPPWSPNRTVIVQESPKKEESQAVKDDASADTKAFKTFSAKMRPKDAFPMSKKWQLERKASLPDIKEGKEY